MNFAKRGIAIFGLYGRQCEIVIEIGQLGIANAQTILARITHNIFAVDRFAGLRQPLFMNNYELVVLSSNLSPDRPLAIERGYINRRPEMPDTFLTA